MNLSYLLGVKFDKNKKGRSELSPNIYTILYNFYLIKDVIL